jgi:hypothetical protein
MENEELFAREPEIDARVCARVARATRPTADATENTPLIDGTDGGLHQQPYDLTDNRPQWRRPSVSDHEAAPKLQEHMSNRSCNHNRFGG